MTNPRRTADDALAQIGPARQGCLVRRGGGQLTAEHLPYLEALRRLAYEWIASIDAEILRVHRAEHERERARYR